MPKFNVSAPVMFEVEIEAETAEAAVEKFAELYNSSELDYTLGDYDEDWVTVAEVNEDDAIDDDA